MKKRLSVICIAFALIIILGACNEVSVESVETAKQTQAATDALVLSEDMLYIVAGDAARYGIVRAAKMSNDTITECTDMFAAIKRKTGVEIPFIDDSRKLKDGVEEILIGNTTRKGSETAREALGDNHWSISIQNRKLCTTSEINSEEIPIKAGSRSNCLKKKCVFTENRRTELPA